MPLTPPSTTAEPMWAAVLNRRLVVLPSRQVSDELLRLLAGVGKDHVLVRDFQSEYDEIIPPNATLDLRHGNVFYTEAPGREPSPHRGPPKLAYALDDRYEIIEVDELPFKAFCELFRLPEDVTLVRDFDQGGEKQIGPESLVKFHEGSAFSAHAPHRVHIEVAVATTSGPYPAVGFDRLPVTQLVIEELDRAKKALSLKDTKDWVAKVGGRTINQAASYKDNQLSGRIVIDFGPPVSGGGIRP